MAANKILEELDVALADLAVLYVKLHNWHWRVKGINFKVIHETTERYYEHVSELYDDVAERMLQIGGSPTGSIKAYLEKAHIKETDAESFQPAQVIDGVLKDFEHIHSHFNRIADLASEASDRGTEDLAVQAITWLEKELWMLRASRP